MQATALSGMVDGAVGEATMRFDERWRPTPSMIEAQKKRMVDAGYLEYDPTSFEILAKFLSYADHRKNKKGLVLWGGNGSGKTRWASSFAPTMRTTQQIMVAYKKYGLESTLDWLSPCREYGDHLNHPGSNLTIDDLGAEPFMNDFGTRLEVLSEVIVDRYTMFVRGKGLTFVTTNLKPDEIAARYNARILSRLSEMCTFVEFTSSDRRMNSEF